MTAFDWIVVVLVVLSTLFAFARGFTRELIALATWVLAFVAATALTPAIASALPEFGPPAARYVVVFLAIVIVVLIAGGLVAMALSGALKAIALGFVDRTLGALFGVARGVLVVLGFVLVAGVTDIPRSDWWQNALLSQPLAEQALALRPWLPQGWAERLDYSREGRLRPGRATPV